MKCVMCRGKKFKETRVSLAPGISATAWSCQTCGELVLEPKAAQTALMLNKLRHGVTVKVGVLGKSLVMRFPAEVANLFGLKKGTRVRVYPESQDKVVLTRMV